MPRETSVSNSMPSWVRALAAALILLMPGSGLAQGTPRPAAPDETPLRVSPPTTVLNTHGGGVLPDHLVYAREIEGWTVQLRDGSELSEVSDVVLNVRSGEAEMLLVAAGGFLGTEVGEVVYDIAWSRIARIDKRAQLIQLAFGRDELRPAPAFETGVRE